MGASTARVVYQNRAVNITNEWQEFQATGRILFVRRCFVLFSRPGLVRLVFVIRLAAAVRIENGALRPFCRKRYMLFPYVRSGCPSLRSPGWGGRLLPELLQLDQEENFAR